MASSGDDLEDDIHGGQDGSGKKSGKKFLHPFRKMRRFFSSRRRGKSREDDPEDLPPGAVKSKSTTDVLRVGHIEEDDQVDESGQLVSNKTLSMSADSVFTPDPRTKDTNLDSLHSSARSMEHLGQPQFTNELFQKLKSRRGEDDDGLPSSPVTQSTADVLNDFKKPIGKRNGSKHSVDSSMYSSEDELEDKNVFEQDWTSVVGASRQNVSAMTDSSERLDLDVVASTTSLVSDVQKFKIAIKPKHTRPSTQHRRPVKSPAPKTLPQLEETEETKPEEKTKSTESLKVESESEGKESPKVEVKELPSSEEEEEDSLEEPVPQKPEDTKVEIQVTADVEPEVDQKRQSDSSLDAENEEVVEEKAEEIPEEQSKPVDQPVTIVIPKSEPKISPKTSPVPPPKSPKPQKKDVEAKRKSAEIVEKRKSAEIPEEPENASEEKDAEPVKSPAVEEDDTKPFNVVLRKTGRRAAIEELGTIRLRENVGERDPLKRQTIAGDAGLTTIFGDRKSVNRNSFVEATRSPEPKEDTGGNEFSQVLNRLKKQPSRKKLIPNEDDSQKKDSVERKSSKGSKEKPVVVDNKPKVTETAKPKVTETKVVESKPKVTGATPQKSSENKPKIPEGKPKISENKPKISENKPKIAESKPKVSEFKPKTPEVKPVVQSPKQSESKVQESSPKEPVSTSTADVSKPKDKEVAVIAKKTESVQKPKEPEVKPTNITVGPSPSKPEPSSEKPTSQTQSKPTISKPAPPKTTTPTTTPTTPAKSDSPKAVIIEKVKPAEPKKPEPEKTELKTPAKEEVKADEKSSFKKDSPVVKNRARSQTLQEQPVVVGANKENEKSTQGVQRSISHGGKAEEKSTPSTTPAEKPSVKSSDSAPSGRTEPAWFTLARKKTANWDQKERDLEQKEKKETSNLAEKERDASTKGKEVTLTIDEAAKEDSKPALRNTGKCSNSAANRQSKVLDMAKLFQNQVS